MLSCHAAPSRPALATPVTLRDRGTSITLSLHTAQESQLLGLTQPKPLNLCQSW